MFSTGKLKKHQLAFDQFLSFSTARTGKFVEKIRETSNEFGNRLPFPSQLKKNWKTKLSATKETETLMNGNPLNTFLTKYSKSIEEQYSEKKNYLKILLWKKKSTPASNVSTEWYMNACVTSTKDWEWTQSPCTMGVKKFLNLHPNF